MRENIEILKNIVLFEDFREDEKTLRKIEKLFVERSGRKGDIIIRDGEEGDELYIIKQGCVRILKYTLQNEPYTVAILSADQHVFFGEIGLLLNDRRTATVVAEEDCLFLVTDRKKFSAFGDEEPYNQKDCPDSIPKTLQNKPGCCNPLFCSCFRDRCRTEVLEG